MLTNRLIHNLTELLILDRLTSETNQVKLPRQQIIHPEIENSRHQLTRSQVAGGTKNNHDRGRCASMLAQAF